MPRCRSFALLLLAGCVPHPEPPPLLPELVLDIADPVIDARIAGVPLRLRVDLDRRDTIELNPAAAARLPLTFEAGEGADVGRIRVAERVAVAELAVGGIAVGRTVSTFDRDCCAGADGAVGPDLLPYARVRFVRTGDAGAGEMRSFPLAANSEGGLSVTQPTPAGSVAVGFSLGYPGTLATAAAGAILATAYGGHFVGGWSEVTPAFGVARSARTISFTRPASLAGFAIGSIPVRTADFRGGFALPSDPDEAGDIVVRRRRRPQAAWPAVLIGRERLDTCSEIVFRRDPRQISLRCDFAAR